MRTQLAFGLTAGEHLSSSVSPKNDKNAFRVNRKHTQLEIRRLSLHPKSLWFNAKKPECGYDQDSQRSNSSSARSSHTKQELFIILLPKTQMVCFVFFNTTILLSCAQPATRHPLNIQRITSFKMH